MKVGSDGGAIPAYLGAMGAEYLWQRSHPVAPGTRAGDYQGRHGGEPDDGAGQPGRAVRHQAGRPGHPDGRGRYGNGLLALGAATALLTTVGDVVRRRLRDGGLPDPQTVPAEVRTVPGGAGRGAAGPAVAP